MKNLEQQMKNLQNMTEFIKMGPPADIALLAEHLGKLGTLREKHAFLKLLIFNARTPTTMQTAKLLKLPTPTPAEIARLYPRAIAYSNPYNVLFLQKVLHWPLRQAMRDLLHRPLDVNRLANYIYHLGYDPFVRIRCKRSRSNVEGKTVLDFQTSKKSRTYIEYAESCWKSHKDQVYCLIGVMQYRGIPTDVSRRITEFLDQPRIGPESLSGVVLRTHGGVRVAPRFVTVR